VTLATSEHFALPRLHPTLRDVDVFLGWFGPLSEPMRVFTAGMAPAMRLPGARGACRGSSTTS